MAELVGCIALSHGPQLLMPPDKWQDLPTRVKEPRLEIPELNKDLTLEVKQAKFNRCMEAMKFLRHKLDEWAPDVVILVGDDQSENILEDNTPPFVFYIGEEFEATLKFDYLGESPLLQKRRYKAHPSVGSFVVEALIDAGFDPAWSRKTRYEGGLGHAFGRPLHFLMPAGNYPIVPIMVNTYYPPTATAKRCLDFGKALALAIRGAKEVDKIVVVGSGGLTHVEIDERLDHAFITAIENYDQQYLSAMASSILVQGTSELRNWIVTAACAGRPGTMTDYVPCYRTNTGIGCAMGFAYWEC